MTDALHRTAAEGFDVAAEVYDRARPGYPAEAVDHMIDVMRMRESEPVVDLAAGTGKFTLELVRRGLRCVAVEPVEGMRRTFARVLPDVEMIDGSAESMPLPDGAAGAITVAQAFHWFANDRALSEMHRVLRPGGTVGLVWNARDEDTDWVARITEIIAPYEEPGGVRVPRHRERSWRAPVESSSLFDIVDEREFPNGQTLTPEGLLERVASVSFVAVLPDDERARVLDRVRRLTRTHPDLRGREEFVHPYATEVYVLRRS